MAILLIEDNDLNAALYVRMLHQAGYEDITLVNTGLDGLHAAQTTPFQACFIDLDLPDIDGLQVGHALRRQMQRGDIPHAALVAVSARVDVQTLAEAQAVGYDAFIRKPCDGHDLTLALETLRGVSRP